MQPCKDIMLLFHWIQESLSQRGTGCCRKTAGISWCRKIHAGRKIWLCAKSFWGERKQNPPQAILKASCSPNNILYLSDTSTKGYETTNILNCLTIRTCQNKALSLGLLLPTNPSGKPVQIYGINIIWKLHHSSGLAGHRVPFHNLVVITAGVELVSCCPSHTAHQFLMFHSIKGYEKFNYQK